MCAIKRSFGLALMVFLSAYSGFPKDGQAPTAKDNLYSVALFASLAAMEKSWNHIDDSDGGTTIRTDYRHMFVEKDPTITNGLPEHQGEYQVEYLDNRGQTERYNNLRKEFALLRIRPMQSDGSQLRIQISVYYFKHKRGKSFYGLSDWSDVEFRYDCENHKFVVSDVKLGGI